MSKCLEAQARILNYRRVCFARDWEIEFQTPARQLFETAAFLARVEGAIGHALALETRLSQLSPNSRYHAGRLKNGCQTARVVGY